MIVGLEHNDFTFYSIWKNSSHLKASYGSLCFVPISLFFDSYVQSRAVIVVALVLLIMAESGWATAKVHNGGWGSTGK